MSMIPNKQAQAGVVALYGMARIADGVTSGDFTGLAFFMTDAGLPSRC